MGPLGLRGPKGLVGPPGFNGIIGVKGEQGESQNSKICAKPLFSSLHFLYCTTSLCGRRRHIFQNFPNNVRMIHRNIPLDCVLVALFPMFQMCKIEARV